MANYIKRLKGYLGPLLLLYTIAVTLFLAQTAWNDGTSSGGNHGGGGVVAHRKGRDKFLDVLVQEERRHFKSFESIVQIDGLPKSHSVKSVDKEVDFKNASGADPSFRKGYRMLMEPRHQLPTRIDAHTGKSPEFLPTQKNDEDPSLASHETKKRPTFKVEVEDWDSLGKLERNSTLVNITGNAHDANSALVRKTPNSFQRLKKVKSSMEQRVGFRPAELTYTLEYCDNVFEFLGVASPNICRRDLVMKGSLDYAEPSKYFLPFKNLADISIYSAFLDHRGKQRAVRVIALGPQGRDGAKSVYECVFYRPVRLSHDDDRDKGNSTVKLKKVPKMTQMNYWAASAGHKTQQQFYIMTCDVPDAALESFYPPYRGAMKIIVRKTDGLSQTDHAYQSIAVNVINNLPDYYDGPKIFNKKMYFNKMEEELMKFTHNDVERDYHSNQTVYTFDNIVNSRNNNSGDTPHDTTKAVNLGANDPPRPRAPGLDRIVACVAPLQGNVGVIQMVEYIELTLLLGAQHLVIYTFRIFDEVKAVLNMYESRGLITVMPWNIPDSFSVWAKGRDAALNDCLYRTMHLFDYALFLDLDEFFVPRVTPDMPSFLRYLRQVHSFNSTKISDIVFSSAYFPPPSKADYLNLSQISGAGKDVGKFLSLKSVRRSYYNQQHTLRMIRPDAAYRVGSGERKKTSYTISTRYASVHHYSYCPRAVTSPAAAGAPQKGANGTLSGSVAVGQKGTPSKTNLASDLCAHTKIDWIMWRYRSVLIERAKQSVRHLNT